MARMLLNCLTVNGIRKIRTITVRTTIDHPQLRDSSSCMYESTVNRTSTRGCRMPKIESIRPFVLSRSSAAYSGRRFDVLRDHTLRGSTDCSAAHANPPGRIRESLPSPAQRPFRTASRWDDTCMSAEAAVTPTHGKPGRAIWQSLLLFLCRLLLYHQHRSLSLIHISEPTRRTPISYA